MRANINIDTDAYDFAYSYANARGLPLGSAVSELLRQREQMPQVASNIPTGMKRDENGFLVIAKRPGRVITPEMVKKYSEDDLG